MNLRRQELIIGVIPPLGGEDPQLAALHDLFDAVLHPFIVGGRRPGQILREGFRFQTRGAAEGQLIGIQHLILDGRRRLRVRLQGFHGTHPVQRVKMIKVDDVILYRQGSRHEVADVIRIFRDLDPQRVLHRP